MAQTLTAALLEDEVNSLNYPHQTTDYERMQEVKSRINQCRIGGRGRGISNPETLSAVRRLATPISANGQQSTSVATRMGQFEDAPENEITPLLRQLGLSSHDDEALCSERTRQNLIAQEKITIDGKLPVILDSTLFHVDQHSETDKADDIERFDPSQPLSEQFSTIPELMHLNKPLAEDEQSQKSSANNEGKKTPKKGKNGKKTKWRKVALDDLGPKPEPRGRYEEVFSIGIHDTVVKTIHAPRIVLGRNGFTHLGSC